MDLEEPIVNCQRCHQPGGHTAYGWAILCDACRENDDDE